MDLALDASVGQEYSSPTQIARVLSEDWVARQAYCLGCGEGGLHRTKSNTQALDFTCKSCSAPYEFKASKRVFRNRILDGEYHAFLDAVSSLRIPNLLLLNYSLVEMVVTQLMAIPREALSRSSVIPRRPLGPRAMRHGWQGCVIDLSVLPPSGRVAVILEGIARPQSVVLEEWRLLDFLRQEGRATREWLPDVISSVRRIASEEFSLAEVYQDVPLLRDLHPSNRNIQPKIRQQLQILVAQGMLERVRPGIYRKTPRIG